MSEEMIQKFQCPGCTRGSDPKTCGAFTLEKSYGFKCASHSAGTFMMPIGRLILGLPKGFNRYGGSVPPSHLKEDRDLMNRHPMHIRMWKRGEQPTWDKFNLATWALVEDGYLFVRTYSPRTNSTSIDIIEGGTLDLCPGAINVGDFIDEMD